MIKIIYLLYLYLKYLSTKNDLNKNILEGLNLNRFILKCIMLMS